MSESTRRSGGPSGPGGVRSAIVSGASGAVGRVVARAFAERGCRLVLPARSRPEALEEAFPDARVVPARIAEPADARRVVAAAEEAFGGPDALVNVAGGFATRSALELELDDLDAQLATNLRTAVALTSAALPGMVARGRGSVIGVSAGAASRGGARLAAYAASKAALEGYLRSVRVEVEPRGVAVSLLIPEGTIDTPTNRAAMPKADPRRWIAPDALAEAAWYLATRPSGGRVAELRISA